MKSFNRRRRAATVNEYALMMGLIVVVAIAAIGSLGANVNLLMNRTANILGNINGANPP